MSAVQATGRVTEVTHPLVQHKLSYLRDKETPTVHFRKLVNELTLLLTYEATKDFPTETFEIETPLEKMQAQLTSIVPDPNGGDWAIRFDDVRIDWMPR